MSHMGESKDTEKIHTFSRLEVGKVSSNYGPFLWH